ncbi:MAG TPA: beta-glucosidase [Maribacter sp.]|uniref:glucoamylase family protein n=1 Tax=unclassified Maribacter TaxID=2615042 RepID=UPI000EBC7133|nr:MULTISPECIES: glucoamylase family protein [unclassified Maribacter]HAF75986.1 beta-glucosidase [Maribacter sp.]|tara:strand:- start:69 stop:1427 length:1359 start_codon:yes stop_codon:yes gene_type:complete
MRLFLISMTIATLLVGCNGQSSKSKLRDQDKQKEDIKLTDEQLLDSVQKQTFNYFWEGAEPTSGLARERIHLDDIYPTHHKDIITIGGSGFGVMAILVGIEREFITREMGLERLEKAVDFLDNADRFHGAWPHWLTPDGKMTPFSKKDNGGDLVETAFLIEGLLTVKEYFKDGNEREQALAQHIQQLWEEVEWDWYTKGENVLYWHWSPEYEWDMNFPVGGYNEALIMYILAAASPTHPIKKEVYDKGWARNGAITKDTTFYGLPTVLDHYESDASPVGPMFWAHYSFTGLNPKGLKDQYADYWELNHNHTMIQYKYAVDNPKNFKGYGDDLWGLTSSYSIKGYDGHRPDRDISVISPTAALSSMPYAPKESMAFLRNLYTNHDTLVGKYGPYDAFSLEKNWVLPRYLAIDQGPIPVMIENHRSGLFWMLFMTNKDVINGLDKLGFSVASTK